MSRERVAEGHACTESFLYGYAEEIFQKGKGLQIHLLVNREMKTYLNKYL